MWTIQSLLAEVPEPQERRPADFHPSPLPSPAEAFHDRKLEKCKCLWQRSQGKSRMVSSAMVAAVATVIRPPPFRRHSLRHSWETGISYGTIYHSFLGKHWPRQLLGVKTIKPPSSTWVTMRRLICCFCTRSKSLSRHQQDQRSASWPRRRRERPTAEYCNPEGRSEATERTKCSRAVPSTACSVTARPATLIAESRGSRGSRMSAYVAWALPTAMASWLMAVAIATSARACASAVLPSLKAPIAALSTHLDLCGRLFRLCSGRR